MEGVRLLNWVELFTHLPSSSPTFTFWINTKRCSTRTCFCSSFSEPWGPLGNIYNLLNHWMFTFTTMLHKNANVHPLPKSYNKSGLPLAFLSHSAIAPLPEWANTEHSVPCLLTAVQTTSFPLEEQDQHRLRSYWLCLKCMLLWSIQIRWKMHAKKKP